MDGSVNKNIYGQVFSEQDFISFLCFEFNFYFVSLTFLIHKGQRFGLKVEEVLVDERSEFQVSFLLLLFLPTSEKIFIIYSHNLLYIYQIACTSI